MRSYKTSVGPGAARLRDLRPLRDLGLDPRGELGARIAHRREGEVVDLALRFRGGEHLPDFRVQLVEDRGGGLRRGAQADPPHALEAPETLLGGGRAVGNTGAQ